MPVNTTPRMWKVTFKHPITNEQDVVFPIATNRNDAILVARECTKLRPEECVVSATTNFDHFDTVEPVEQKVEKKMESIEETFAEGLGSIDRDKSPVSQEEILEEKMSELPWPPHGAIIDAIVAYFVRMTAPRMTATELLNVFEDCPASIKDLKKFLDDHNLNW